MGTDSKKCYEVEARVFNKLRSGGLEKSHIVGYHCSYEHRGAYYAVFELADKDTLENYMKKNPPPSTNAEIASFWGSMLPIIEAIITLHDMQGSDDESTKPFRDER